MNELWKSKAIARLPPEDRRGKALLTPEMVDWALARYRAGWTIRAIQEAMVDKFGFSVVIQQLHRRVTRLDDEDRALWWDDPCRIVWSRQPLGLVPEAEIAQATGEALPEIYATLERLGIEPVTPREAAPHEDAE